MLSNIFFDNSAYAVNTNTQPGILRFADYNCYSSNTSGVTDMDTIPGINNVFADPEFTDTTLGSEDFSLQAGSPCLGTGAGY